MRTKKKPDPLGKGESGQSQKIYKPNNFNKKFDKIILRKISGQNLGLFSKLAGSFANRLEKGVAN